MQSAIRASHSTAIVMRAVIVYLEIPLLTWILMISKKKVLCKITLVSITSSNFER